MYKILLQNNASGGVSQLLFIGAIFVIMYFFMIRPQIKKQKNENKFRQELKKGDKVITQGGIHGKIIDLKDNTAIIENNGVKLKVSRSHLFQSGV